MGSKIAFLVISLVLSGVTWYLYAILRASGLHEHRMKGFNALCICLPFWLMLNALSTLVEPEYFTAVFVLKSIPIDMMPYLSCWFLLHFMESKAADSRAVKYFSIAMPVLSIGMEFTNPWHGLYLISIENPPVVGPLFLAHLSVSFVYMLVVYCMLFRYIIKNYRSNPLLVIGGIGTIIPIAVYAFYLFFPSLPYDVTPIGYFLTIIFVAYASYAKRLKKNKPGLFGETLAKIAISQEISSGSIEDAARLIAKESCIALDAYRVGVWFYKEKTSVIKNITYFASSTNEYYVQDDFDLQNYPAYKELIETGRIAVINDRKEFIPGKDILGDYAPEICSLADAPIRIDGKPVGIVCAEQKKCLSFPVKRVWNLDEQSFISSLADLMAFVIINTERQALIRQLEDQHKALFDSEERMLLLMDTAPLSVILIDKNFQCIFVNEESVRLYGLSSKQEYLDLYSTGRLVLERGGEFLRVAFKEGRWHGELIAKKPDGEIVPCEITLIRMKYKGDDVIAGYARDLRTEIIAAEKIQKAEEEKFTIEQAHEQLRVIFDLLPVGIVIMRSDDGAILYANNTALKVYNAQNVGKDISKHNIYEFIQEVQPDGRKTVDVIAENINKGGDVIELNCIKFTGESFWARVAFCVINYNGVNATLNAIEDITVEREHQQMLKIIAIKEQEANQLKTRFLANMSHEIRTPMNAIIGMSELALREKDTDAMKAHIYTVKQAGTNLLSIINDILDFSKIESGRLEIVEAEYSFPSLLNDVVNIIRIKIMNTRLRFYLRIDNNIPKTLIGDESRIRQVLINLLGNAVKYTESGFVSLFIFKRFTDNNNVELVIEVEDSGIGIKQEDIGSLFNEFAQVGAERSNKIEGVGLGLAISSNIVKAMGGHISVDSVYGEGSAFTVTLPQKYETPEPLAAVADPEHKNVLAYERLETGISSIIFAVDNLGVEYTIVSNNEELYEKISANKYDFLFIPFDLYEENRETIERYGKNTRTVFLSEYGESIYGNDMSAAAIPVYCITVADILNAVPIKYGFDNTGEPGSFFTAPYAKILIVDDMYTNLHVAHGLMKQYNMDIDLCQNGMEAIEAVKSAHYDMVFMDHRMPGMDGIEATRRIREMGVDVPIIALTANAVSGTKEMFLENGLNDVLFKPIDTVKLHEILKKWIPKEKQITT